MNWHDIRTFFEMGGYGLYVWGSFAVTAALMLAEPLLLAQRHRRARAQLGDAQEGSRA